MFMVKPLSIRLKEVEQKLFELQSDRDNVGNNLVIVFIENEMTKLEKEKSELEQKLQVNLW